MNTLPVPADSSSQPGRVSRPVAAVLPVARPGPAPSTQEPMRESSHVDQARREALMAEHAPTLGADRPGNGGHARRALARYDAVADIEQRQQIEETLRFSVWA